MSSNLVFQTLTLATLTAHAAVLAGLRWAPRGLFALLGLNAVVALAVLLYAATRARFIFSPLDWPYLGLIAAELLVLAGAIWAFKDSRVAVVGSYVAFALHGMASLAAVVFAFAFKLNKLI